jgi:ABC-2 type transport system ATP-binding protein
MNHEYLAELRGVRKRFGAITALDGLDLEVRRGEVLAVLGPNGAGKSTAMALLWGLQSPDAGVVRLFGQPPERLEARRRIGVMMQEVMLAPELYVHEHIDLFSSCYDAPLPLDDVTALTHIESLAHRPYGKLSGGQKRQVQFALAICGRPELLFLDEPTVGLDVSARTLVWATVRQLSSAGASIVLSTHYLEEAEALADRVAVLARGRTIATGTVDEIRGTVDRKRIVCRTQLPPAQIEGWPDVESVSRTATRLHLTVRNAEGVLRLLLSADRDVHDVEVLRAGLTEAFTEITQESVQ